MRICIAYNSTNSKKIEEFARSLGEGIETQTSCVIDLLDINKDSDKRLTAYTYLIFADSKSTLFSSKTNKAFSFFLKNCGHITGKHTFVFTKGGFGAQKYLTRFMKEVESEGVLLKSSSLITSKEEAKIIGSKLHLK